MDMSIGKMGARGICVRVMEEELSFALIFKGMRTMNGNKRG